jgi:Tol biopolymer transport system component
LRATMILFALFVLLPIGTDRAGATYPGKNGRIALALFTGSDFQINTIRPNGEGLTQLTGVTGSAVFPDWSPDGSKIVFEIDPSGGTQGCRVDIMNSDGTGVKDLTPNLVARRGCAWDPSFTPTGTRILYLSQRCGRCTLWISSMDLHGRTRRRVVSGPPGDQVHAPHVSPDGHTIVFLAEKPVTVGGVDGNRKALYTVRMNGTHMVKIVPFRFDICICGGDWAPNGRRIVASDQAGPTPVPGRPSNLFTVRSDGSGMRLLTHSSSTDVYISGGSYAPNGRWIAFKRVTPKGTVRLMKIHPSGRGRSLIAKPGANFAGRDWGPRPT